MGVEGARGPSRVGNVTVLGDEAKNGFTVPVKSLSDNFRFLLLLLDRHALLLENGRSLRKTASHGARSP